MWATQEEERNRWELSFRAGRTRRAISRHRVRLWSQTADKQTSPRSSRALIVRCFDCYAAVLTFPYPHTIAVQKRCRSISIGATVEIARFFYVRTFFHWMTLLNLAAALCYHHPITTDSVLKHHPETNFSKYLFATASNAKAWRKETCAISTVIGALL